MGSEMCIRDRCTYFVFFIILASSQLTSTIGNATATIFSTGDLNLFPDLTSIFYGSDVFRNTEISRNNIYTLGLNNIVQIYSKSDLSVPLQNFTYYSYGNNRSKTIVYVSVSQDESLMALTAHSGTVLEHLIWSIDRNGVVTFKNTTVGFWGLIVPKLVFWKGNKIYTYMKRGIANDSIEITDITSNSSTVVTLNVTNCSVVVSPNREKVVVWDRHSRVYIYSTANNLTLEYIYNGSVIVYSSWTETISISKDS